jgi:transcriptional regulator GlxA family with amidase domain
MTEIAGMLGFASAAAFNAWFAARWRLPPGRWRRRQKLLAESAVR